MLNKIIVVTVALFILGIGYGVYTKSKAASKAKQEEAVAAAQLEADRKEFAEFDWEETDMDKIGRHNELAYKLAVASTTLEVSGCRIIPDILSIAENETLTFLNRGVWNIIVNFPNNEFKIPPRSTIEAPVKSFGKTGRMYGIGCYSHDRHLISPGGVVLVR